MLRIVLKACNCEATQVGADPEVYFKTFDVELPEVEKWLKPASSWTTVNVVGIEILPGETTPEAEGG